MDIWVIPILGFIKTILYETMCAKFFFIKHFYFEIIINSHAVLRSNMDKLHVYFIWFSPMITSLPGN